MSSLLSLSGLLQLGVTDGTKQALVQLAYLIAILFFILGLKRQGRVRTARGGNAMCALAMLIATAVTLANTGVVDWKWIIGGLLLGSAIGAFGAIKVQSTEMPEMVALLNGSGGAASLLVGLAVLTPVILLSGESGAVVSWVSGNTLSVTPLDQAGKAVGAISSVSLALSILVGGITLTGSLVAYAKLAGKMSGNAITFPGQLPVNLSVLALTLGLGFYMALGCTDPSMGLWLMIGITVLSLALGVMLVIPIGGADMPVVISLLNSYSGVAAAMTGFVLHENVLIVSGAMVGAAGLILTNIMCKAMNRSLFNVLVGGFGEGGGGGGETAEEARSYTNVKATTGEELAMLLDGVSSVIIVPGYGLAVAQAQHAVRELADLLEAQDVLVRYAIHPVAGRMPGHMNVLLAEANISYDKLVEMDEINPDFKSTDLVLVIGANDVVNPASLGPPPHPLAGMPILNAHEANMVVIIKRSLSPGYAGVRNPLFEMENANMLFGDAKAAIQEAINEFKENAS